MTKKVHKKALHFLAEKLVELLPLGPSGLLCPLLVNQVLNVQVAATSVEVHLVRPDKLSTVVELVGDEKGQHDGGSQVAGEEGIHQLRGGLLLVADGSETNPELGDQHQAVEDETDPGANDTGLRAESQLIQAVALNLPGATESDVSEADGAPGEDGRETGDGHHPSKGNSLLVRGSQEAEQTEGGGDADGPERATLAVDVGQEAGSLTLLGKGGEGTRGTIDGGVTDRQHGNHDDDVHDGGQTLDTGIFDGNDEGRSLSIGRRATTNEFRVVVGDEQANKGERDHVEEGNTPEHLLDSSGERLAGVGSLGGSQTNQLGTSKGEGCINEHTAKTLEAIVEGTGVVPVASTNIATLGATTTVQNDSEDTNQEVSKSQSQKQTEAATYMNPMTAITLMVENTNSASP